MKRILILFSLITSSFIMTGQDPAYYLMKSKALIDQGKSQEAEGILTKALQEFTDSRIYILRAEAFLSGGDYSKAINDLNSANNVTPLSGEYGLARIYGLKGDASTAIYHLESSMRSPYKKSEKEIMLDPSFSLIDNRPEWRQFWRNDWYSSLEKGLSEIEYNLSTGRKDEARNVLKDLSADYPDDKITLYTSSLVAFYDGKYGETVKMLTGIINENPGDEKALRLMAKVQESYSNYAGASDTYGKLLSVGIPDPEILIMRAECYKRTGEAEKALADILKYLDLYPGSKKAISFAGKVEAYSGDNLKALEYFSENLKLHPNDPDCYIDRANSYFVSKSWELALKDYSMALDLNPENPEAWLNKGISLLGVGKTDDACFDFRESFRQGNRKATEYISRNCIK